MADDACGCAAGVGEPAGNAIAGWATAAAGSDFACDAGGDDVRVEARDFCVRFGSGAAASIEPRP